MDRLLSDLVELFEISDKGRPVELVLSIANGGAGVDIESVDICASLRFCPVDVLCYAELRVRAALELPVLTEMFRASDWTWSLVPGHMCWREQLSRGRRDGSVSMLCCRFQGQRTEPASRPDLTWANCASRVEALWGFAWTTACVLEQSL
jgi:hypothetical protein